jgi:O-antigen/teichoic acid export membrane protein
MIFSIPFCFAGIGLSTTIIRLLFGSAYLPMAPVLNVLLISSCFGIIASPGSSVYYATERQGYMVKIGLCIAILNIVLNLSLIPVFGAVGAAIANSVSQAAAVIIGTSIICRILVIRFPMKDLVKIIFSGVCMLAWISLSSFFIEGILHAILSLITSIIIYLAMIFLFKVITKTDVKLFAGLKDKIPAIIQPSYSKLLRAMQHYAS